MNLTNITKIMDETELLQIVNLLKKAMKNADWDLVQEALEISQEYVEDESDEG